MTNIIRGLISSRFECPSCGHEQANRDDWEQSVGYTVECNECGEKAEIIEEDSSRFFSWQAKP